MGWTKLISPSLGVHDFASLDLIADIHTWNGGIAIDIGTNRIQINSLSLANFNSADIVA